MNKLNFCKKIYLSIFALIVAFVGIFGLSWSQKDSIASVSADEVSTGYIYDGANILINAYLFNSQDFNDRFQPSYSYVSFFFASYVESSPGSVYFAVDKPDLISNDFNSVYSFESGRYGIALSSSDTNSWFNLYVPVWYGSSLESGSAVLKYLVFGIFMPDGFDFNIHKFAISSIVGFGPLDDVVSTRFEYFDSQNRAFTILIPSIKPIHTDSDSPTYGYEYRQYYTVDGLVTDNDYYQVGYNNGYNVGKNDGISEGTAQGYNNGFSAGKNVGFDEGVASANDYSFLSLMGAVVDAPLNMFIQTFDFNILGFNMKDFFLSILTIALIFTIIRLCMGGKS